LRRSTAYSGRRAFSLVETIVAAVLLSGGVVAVSAISTNSFRGVKLNRENELAWDLLDKQLTLIDFMGIDAFVDSGQTTGLFEGEGGQDPTHYWDVQVSHMDMDYLYSVNIIVGWGAGSRLREISLTTMFNGQGLTEQTEAGSNEQTQGQ
jgi:Tfp pilus assembly protein PilV